MEVMTGEFRFSWPDFRVPVSLPTSSISLIKRMDSTSHFVTGAQEKGEGVLRGQIRKPGYEKSHTLNGGV